MRNVTVLLIASLFVLADASLVSAGQTYGVGWWGKNSSAQRAKTSGSSRQLYQPERTSPRSSSTFSTSTTDGTTSQTSRSNRAPGTNTNGGATAVPTDTTPFNPPDLTTQPPYEGPPFVTSIAAGLQINLALKSDGSVWIWGNNTFGHPPGKLLLPKRAVKVATGASHGLILLEDRTVWGLGDNVDGEVGVDPNLFLGNFINRPTQVANLVNAFNIAAGGFHSLAVTDWNAGRGTVWAWGLNDSGQLGDGTIQSSPIPKKTLFLDNQPNNGLVDNQSGPHSFALVQNGGIAAWGNDVCGELGLGLTGVIVKAPQLIPNFSNVKSVVSASNSTAALKFDGAVWIWGCGQLGNGKHYDSSLVPIKVLTDVKMVSAGYDHYLVLKSDGTVWAWGRNFYGALGDGTFVDRDTPFQIPNLTNICFIRAGYDNSFAIKCDDRTVWGWGDNSQGQTIGKKLGNNPDEWIPTPTQVEGL